MPNARLIAILTALTLLSGGRAALAAGFTYEQLVEVDRLVASKDYSGLKSFIEANPQVLIGDEPLANELRLFLLRFDSGQLTTFDSPFWSERAGTDAVDLGSLPLGDVDDTAAPGPQRPPRRCLTDTRMPGGSALPT